MNSERKIFPAFIVSKFPCYDEAFILREIDAMAREMDIRIFSLRHSSEAIVHDQAQALLPKTLHVPYFLSCKIWAAHASMIVRRPGRYFRALSRLIAGNLKSSEFLMKSLAFFPKAVYLAHWAEKEGITNLHAYWATYPASVGLVASEISGIPFSFTGHAHDIYLNTTHLKEKIEHAKFVTTCTTQNKDYLLKVAGAASPPEKIMINYHGLDLGKFDVPGKKRNEIFEILSVGTLNPHKGFNYLVSALEILNKKGLQFHCTIVGGGPLDGDIKKHIHMLGLDGLVTMTGPLKQAQVIPYYKAADLMVLMCQPEWHWGIPNVLIEALAAKAPVITTLFGSVEELVKNEKTGYIVPPKDPVPLAEKIELLYRDDALRTRLMEEGRKFVLENFDLSKNIRNFIGRLEEAAS